MIDRDWWVAITSCATGCVRCCGFTNCIGFRRGAQCINRTEGEKPAAVRIAAIRGDVQPSENPPKSAFFHPLLGNSLQFQVSASRAAWTAEKCNGCGTSIKSALAFHASPRSQRHYRRQPVSNSAPVRAQAIFVSAGWTNHLLPPLFAPQDT